LYFFCPPAVDGPPTPYPHLAKAKCCCKRRCHGAPACVAPGSGEPGPGQ
jgi:hypothetical protein